MPRYIEFLRRKCRRRSPIEPGMRIFNGRQNSRASGTLGKGQPMKISRILICGVVLCNVCAMSCSSRPSSVKGRTILSAHDPVALFPETGNFAFARLSKLPADPRARGAELENQLRQAIVREMTSKGYTLGDSPRLLFSVDVSYHGAEPSLQGDEYERVSCVVTITEPASGAVMWRGLYVGAVVVEVDESERNAQVRDGISQMFKRFPPIGGLTVP